MTLAEIVSEERSTFNVRFGMRLADGALVEAVHYRGDSLCISSQVGCAVRCPFCASGANGLGRNLTLEELRAQLEVVRALGLDVLRTTVSGVGEPLHNADAVFAFLADARAAGAPASLTTSGGPIARLRELFALPHNGITVSVHAGTERVRSLAVPKGPALEPLFEALAEARATLPRKRRKKLALAYLLVADLNDGDDEVAAFVERARPLGLAVHLYAYNPVATSTSRPVSRARYEAVYATMREAGLVVRMSSQARVEANGGCGTLVALRVPKSVAS